jgi:hypothetical protein
VRLLLDEHYSKQISEQLRARGHDVVSVTERPELEGLADEALLRLMWNERRTTLTENWSDFGQLIERARAEGWSHAGVIFTSRGQLPRSKGTIGMYVRALEALLARYPGDDAIVDSYRWLGSDDVDA